MKKTYQSVLEQRVLSRTAELSRKTDIAEEANRQKSRALAHVSHDMKTPLVGMALFLNGLMEDLTLSSDQRTALEHIKMGLEQMRSILNEILDKVRLEDGAVEITPEVIDIQLFSKSLLPLLSYQIMQKNISVGVEIQPDLQTTVLDPVLLRQILLNLLSNAIKYNHPDGHVTLRVYKNTGDTDHLVMEVEDSGMGIPEDKLPWIFAGYYRVNQNSAEEGSGLGLSYTKKLAQFMGGNLVATSESGVGSCFILTLPEAA